MKRGELAKKKRKGCLTALLVVWAVFMVKVIAVLNPGFPEAWRMVEAGQIAGFAYIWLLVFLVLLCCFVLWRIVPKGYFRKKKPETSRPAGEWAVSIPTHENPVVVGNPFRGIFIAGAAGSGKSESVAVPLLLEFIRKGFAGIVYDFKFPALDNIYKQVGEKLACALDKPFLLGVVRLVMYRFDISCKFTQLCERIYYRNGGLRGSWAFHYGSQHIQPSFGKGSWFDSRFFQSFHAVEIFHHILFFRGL